ncbi:MAG: LysR family transcriptional regulator [Methylophilaceae bacterium]
MAFDEKILNGMSVIAAIVETGSFAGGGNLLNMSQPGISRSVARLESRLHIRLFDRTTQSVKLTDEGRRFYEQIVPLLAGLEDVANSTAKSREIVSGRLRVNVSPYFSNLLLSSHLGTLMDAYPELQLDIITKETLGDLILDGIDVAVRFGHPPTTSLVAKKLFDLKIVTIASPDYIEKHGRPNSPYELEANKHVLINYIDPETGRPFKWEFHRGGESIIMALPGRLSVNQVSSAQNICLTGHGIAQLMTIGIEKYLEDGKLIDLFPDWPDERWPVYALYPSRKYMPAKVRVFLDFLTSISSN